MKYSPLQLGILTLICAVVVGCAAKAIDPPILREMIVFDYNPIKEATAGGANVTFAVVGTQVGSAAHATETSILEEFADNMTKDFMEILTARGFGVRGPFDTYDEMNFPDKNESDLILTADFGITLDTSAVRFTRVGRYTWIPKGRVAVKGYIYLLISESLTNEKMWSKKVPITPFRVEYVSRLSERLNLSSEEESDELKNNTEIEEGLIQYGAVPADWELPVVDAEYTSYNYVSGLTEEQKAENERFNEQVADLHRAVKKIRGIPWQMLVEQSSFYNALGKSLQAQYYEVLNKTYGYLNPEEMAIVKNQSQELRKRKVY